MIVSTHRSIELLVALDRSCGVLEVHHKHHPPLDPASKKGLSSIWCSGFIANRKEILSLTGLQPNSSDTQLLTALYLLDADKTAIRIAGPFSWVLWDGENRRLIVTRDRLGHCGLYYRVIGNTVLIANKVEPLVNVPPANRSINKHAVIAHINVCCPPSGETFYQEVYAVQPGYQLQINSEQIKTVGYWQVQPQPLLRLSSDQEYAQAFSELLNHVVTEYTPSNSVGITLSGGLDSTSLCAGVRSAMPDTKIIAFCWVTPELPSADESIYAHAVAQKLSVETVDIRADRCWPLFSDVGINTYADSPCFPFYTELWDVTFKTVRDKGLRTLFSGISGDHLFGGNVYSYPDLFISGHWIRLFKEISVHLPRSGLSFTQLIRSMVLGPIYRLVFPYFRAKPGPAAPWLNCGLLDIQKERSNNHAGLVWLLPGRLQRLNTLKDPLLPYILEYINRQASTYRIDFRHPFLDHRLIDFALSLPTTQTFYAGARKTIIRNAMHSLLPDSVLNMPYKIYPTDIAHRGLRDREQEKIRRLITNTRAAELGFINEEKLQNSYEDYLQKKNDSLLFWYTLGLEDWLRRHF